VVTPGGAIEDGAVVFDDRILYLGPAAGAPSRLEDCGEAVITAGLVDAHTHACWVGSRHAEYAVRMAGGDYRDIAAAGGGIVSTARAIAQASEDDLEQALVARLQRMARMGVTTVEVKSGYGLEPAQEMKQLRAIARAAARSDLPHVVPTFLALHALPKGADRAAFVKRATELVTEAAPLARFVDAYVDENAFTVEEARGVGRAALAAGLGVRLHVGQFADVGGAELCAELGARSADHLEHASDAAIAALARAGTAAVLLPVASFTLGQAPPPVQKLRDAGVPLVVASDANPGTAPTESLPLAMAMAVRLYGLSPAEALDGATHLAARSLDCVDRGHLEVGARADLVVWDLPHEQALVQPWGTPRARHVFRDGVAI
jgi:imidazolonepropionase